MVRKKRNAYLFAPLTPLFGVLLFGIGNLIIGLIGSIWPPATGWIMAVLLPFLSVPATLVIVFIAVLGVLTFGLMLPAVSIGGKDAFEGWSSAYSYLLWGFNRWVGYTVIAVLIWVISGAAVWGLAELFIYLFIKTVSMGLLPGDLVNYAASGLAGDTVPLMSGSVGLQAASWVAVVIAFIIRCLALGYVFSYFFTSNTVICFLLRKHVDRIDVDQVYEEEAEEEFEEEFEEPVVSPEEGEEAEGEAEEQPQAEEPSEEPGAPEEGPEPEETEEGPEEERQ
jgi:hypothetical protein